jgi:WD40 repeat protein
VATGKEYGSIGGEDTDVCSLAFSPDGKALASGLRNSTILIWEVATRK